MGRNGVGQTARIIDAGDRRQNLGWDLFVQFDVLVKLLHHCSTQSLNFTRLGFVSSRGNWRHRSVEMGFCILYGGDQGTLLAFHQHLDGAVGKFEHLQDGRDTADIKHIRHRRLVFGGCLLGDQHDAPLGFHGQLQRLDAFGSSHKEGDNHMGKHHHITQGQQWKVKGGGWEGGMSGHGNPQLTLWNMVHIWGFSTLARSRTGARVAERKGCWVQARTGHLRPSWPLRGTREAAACFLRWLPRQQPLSQHCWCWAGQTWCQ